MDNNSLHRIAIESDNFELEFNDALNKRNVSFVIKWSRGGPLKFRMVAWKVMGGTWNSAISQTFNSTSGSESLTIGNFDPGISIVVKFSVEAFHDIPQAVVFIVQTNPAGILAQNPAAGFKAIPNGDRWELELHADIK